MADPLSITASIIGIAAATIKSAKLLFELIDDIKNGPSEIRSVSKDAHAFHSTISALSATLKDSRVWHVIERDDDLVDMIRSLSPPLGNCQELLGELIGLIRKQLRRSSDSRGSKTVLVLVHWTLFTKGRLRALQVRFEASKSTLCSALNTFSLYAP